MSICPALSHLLPAVGPSSFKIPISTPETQTAQQEHPFVRVSGVLTGVDLSLGDRPVPGCRC